jgi:hypothetical protein
MAAAAPDSALTCFGVGGSAPRAYYVQPTGHIFELSWETDGWYFTDLTAKSGAAPAPTGTALTCFGVGGTDSRVYYMDSSGHVNELAWVGAWSSTDVTAKAGAPPGAPASALTCFGVGTSASRVYYLEPNGHVVELAWMGKWRYSDVTTLAGAASAAPGSALACFAANGSVSRIYYLDTSGHVHELAWVNGWRTADITAMAKASPAIAGSALACFGFGIGADNARVYYLQANGHVNELAWLGEWVANDVTPQAGANPAALRSALCCFGAGGTGTRLYYLQDNNHVFELAWLSGIGWVSTDVTLQAGAAPASSTTPLTCFGAGGSDAPVYCLDANDQVLTLTWVGRWAASILS